MKKQLENRISENNVPYFKKTIYLWYCGVDSGCDDCLQGFSLKRADEKTAIVQVRYNTFGNIDVHEMKLVYSDGQWYCDNWDNMREIIQEGLKRADHK